ncbi:universal stress protein PHOS34-like [Bidens hawaiensis]|uniref:universal stress protein PHOS34-like n=1 Tax=Bidens hawaiensis TaxID=980011 RepID=UPI004048EF76
MQPENQKPLLDSDLRPIAAIKLKPTSPHHRPTTTPATPHHQRIGIAVYLSYESAFAVKWAVNQYLGPDDSVILIHIRPTSVLYGADWGSVDLSIADIDTDNEESKNRLEDEFNTFTKVLDINWGF